MRQSWLNASVPWYPVVVAGTYVLNLWVESGVSLLASTRSLLVAVVLTGALLAVVWAITRRRHVAGVATTAILAILISRGPTHYLAVAALLATVPAALWLWARIRGTALSWPSVTRGLNVLSVILLVVVLAGGVMNGQVQAAAGDLQQGASSLPARVDGGAGTDPDVLVLLLDGYPRADALAERFGADNADFQAELERRGFTIASGSRSNYPYTQATLSSMLHMRPLHEITALDPLVAGDVPDYPLLRVTLNDNPTFEFLRERGYTIVASSPGYEHVTLRRADVFLDDGSLNEFERQLIRGTTIQLAIDAVAPDALAGQHRNRILAGFPFFEEVALHGAGPTFALIHVPSPHEPVVLDGDGELLRPPPPLDAFRDEPLDPATREIYLDQLRYLNRRTLAALDVALARPGDAPVIVVVSDHGAAPPALPGEPWTAEHYANFLAVRVPDGVDHAFPQDASPVNLFPRLFDALFGTDLQTWPDQPFPWDEMTTVPDLGGSGS